MQSATIGFTRDDGDFEILATLNNTAQHYAPEIFAVIVKDTAEALMRAMGHQIDILEREDAPDVITNTGA
mgnify:CR=1 FL=1